MSTGESWTTIGARVGVDPAVLAARNGLSIREPLTPGDVLGIDNRHIVPAYGEDGLLINLPQRMLFYVAQGIVSAHYPVAVGRQDWRTPLGSFSIVSMDADPEAGIGYAYVTSQMGTTLTRDPRGVALSEALYSVLQAS